MGFYNYLQNCLYAVFLLVGWFFLEKGIMLPSFPHRIAWFSLLKSHCFQFVWIVLDLASFILCAHFLSWLG